MRENWEKKKRKRRKEKGKNHNLSPSLLSR
jgi:hypothetical protein